MLWEQGRRAFIVSWIQGAFLHELSKTDRRFYLRAPRSKALRACDWASCVAYMSFQRRIENFVCEHCGTHVVGDGYTNHCPHCLWSKHVDVSPGDRAAACGGLMKPVAVEGTTDSYVLVHTCESCGEIRRNRADKNDDPDAIVSIAGKVM